MHPITWDFDRVLVYIPFIDFPIYWYGFLFAIGVFLAQSILKKNLFKIGLETPQTFQTLILKLVIGIALGARIFDILFYQDIYYFLQNPWQIFNFRAGGLASHGGFFGFIVVLLIYSLKSKKQMFGYLSEMIAPAGILAFFIRLGNLFNQEILGKAYEGWGAFIFKNPLDGASVIPRHPVVIYEALSYLIIGLVIQKIKISLKQKVGIALSAFFTARIFLEIFKEEQSRFIFPYGITMGMLLSIPIVLIGLYLVLSPQDMQYRKSQLKHQEEV